MPRERLHKILAHAGVASRRRAEALIAEGHVTVDGMTVTSMGVLVDPESQDVRYDGERVVLERPVYYAVHKPKGVLSSRADDFGRPTVVSLINERQGRRIYPVGRLEEESEGLILVTNDGDFANLMTHARYGIDRTYEVRVRGYIDAETIGKARQGVWLSDGKTPPIQVYLIRRSKQFSLLKVVARGGGDRDLRRVFARLGHNVDRLVRTKIGSVTVGGLKRGAVRLLSREEVAELIERTKPEHAAKKPAARRPRGKERAVSGATTRRRPSR